MSDRLSRTSRRGFTIVELLVVLAIVGLLLALLIPSLSRARAQAMRTQCLNNIRQIGIGIVIYVHDYDELPPPEVRNTGVALMAGPVWYSSPQTGLLALGAPGGFVRSSLACPEGWASGGESRWYEGRAYNSSGAAYMDYAYWGGRYPTPAKGFDVRAASFKYRAAEKGTKVLVMDVVADATASTRIVGSVGSGNHSNHSAPVSVVPMTDGRGQQLPSSNRIRSEGGHVLFSDNSAFWFDKMRFTQQAEGLCYPPPDQWHGSRP
jgi:prepilin-type N-terminal cleavage/methylation domain-containing protein